MKAYRAGYLCGGGGGAELSAENENAEPHFAGKVEFENSQVEIHVTAENW